MHTILSIRELSRSGKILCEYDYIDIEDKKSHQYKGVFVPEKHATEVKNLINEKLLREKDERNKALMKYAGIAKGDIGERSIQELKRESAVKGR